MNHGVDPSPSFDTTAGQWIHLIGVGIEIFGVFIIVAGIIWSSRFIYRREDSYKISIGRSLLLGLEVLVAADIVKTIAIELTFASLGLLAGFVLVRTFLSWTLVLEIEGRWPWQRELAPAAHTIRHKSIETSIFPISPGRAMVCAAELQRLEAA